MNICFFLVHVYIYFTCLFISFQSATRYITLLTILRFPLPRLKYLNFRDLLPAWPRSSVGRATVIYPEVAGSNPAGVKDFSLILVLISNFFFQAVRPGGNYVGQYCSLLALIHILYLFIYSVTIYTLIGNVRRSTVKIRGHMWTVTTVTIFAPNKINVKR